jgi:crotonobetainyl-CoA:carnitine CoA-transferase CaiB-like acyl-CoA transferase
LLDIAKFSDKTVRLRNRDALTEILDAHLSTKPVEHWMDRLGGYVPCAPVYNLADALENPYLHERGGILTIPHPNKPDLRVVQSPIRLDEPTPNRPAPALGADTRDILRELGYKDDAIQQLLDSRVT